MSRFYSCPPNGSQRRGSGALKEAARISEPIKIHRGKEKIVLKLRKEKTVNKNRTRVRKTKEDIQYVGDKDHPNKKSFFTKGKVEEAEKSDITQEHEEPVSQSSCCFADSTQGSSKIANDAPVLTVSGKNRNIIRIRLCGQRRKELEPSVSETRSCSTSGCKDLVIQTPDECPSGLANVKVNVVYPEPASGRSEESSSSDLKRKKLASRDDRGPTDESLSKVLIEDWVPLPLQFHLDVFDDEEWLFETKTKGKHREKRCKTEEDVLWTDSSYLWPRAKYLQEANIHALPYTVPF